MPSIPTIACVVSSWCLVHAKRESELKGGCSAAGSTVNRAQVTQRLGIQEYWCIYLLHVYIYIHIHVCIFVDTYNICQQILL